MGHRQQPDPAAAVQARTLPGDDLRLGPRAKTGTFVYDETRRVAAALTELGCDIVTGGGPGLMQAANEGASDRRPGRATSARSASAIDLPFEQEVNAFVTQVYEHRTFFTRLHHFVLASDAFVVMPGGIGTVLEAMMVWQLLQVGHITDTPLIFVGRMWSGLVEWACAHMLDPRSPWPAARISRSLIASRRLPKPSR